jgi:predicted transcriptional regulator
LNKDAHYAELTEAKKELDKTKKELEDTKCSLDKTKREKKLPQVLESLQGRPREIMEAILNSVPTEKLDEAYKTFIPRVLNESAVKVEEVKTEKESVSPVLAEGQDTVKVEEQITGVTKSGDSVQKIEESVEEPVVVSANQEHLAQLRRLAGLQ